MSRRPGRDVAAEIDRLVDALGLDEWNLFGASYGSRLALVTLSDHPDGIRCVLLEGVFPPDVVPAALEFFDNALRSFDEVAVACAADAGCASQSGPNPPQLLDRLRSRFQIAATGASPHYIDRPACGGIASVRALRDVFGMVMSLPRTGTDRRGETQMITMTPDVWVDVNQIDDDGYVVAHSEDIVRAGVVITAVTVVVADPEAVAHLAVVGRGDRARRQHRCRRACRETGHRHPGRGRQSGRQHPDRGCRRGVGLRVRSRVRARVAEPSVLPASIADRDHDPSCACRGAH